MIQQAINYFDENIDTMLLSASTEMLCKPAQDQFNDDEILPYISIEEEISPENSHKLSHISFDHVNEQINEKEHNDYISKPHPSVDTPQLQPGDTESNSSNEII